MRGWRGRARAPAYALFGREFCWEACESTTVPSNCAIPRENVRPLPLRRLVPSISVGCGATFAVVSEKSFITPRPLLNARDWVLVKLDRRGSAYEVPTP